MSCYREYLIASNVNWNPKDHNIACYLGMHSIPLGRSSETKWLLISRREVLYAYYIAFLMATKGSGLVPLHMQ